MAQLHARGCVATPCVAPTEKPSWTSPVHGNPGPPQFFGRCLYFMEPGPGDNGPMGPHFRERPTRVTDPPGRGQGLHRHVNPTCPLHLLLCRSASWESTESHSPEGADSSCTHPGIDPGDIVGGTPVTRPMPDPTRRAACGSPFSSTHRARFGDCNTNLQKPGGWVGIGAQGNRTGVHRTSTRMLLAAQP